LREALWLGFNGDYGIDCPAVEHVAGVVAYATQVTLERVHRRLCGLVVVWVFDDWVHDEIDGPFLDGLRLAGAG